MVKSSTINYYQPIRLRVLSPVYDLKLFKQAWCWQDEKPEWFKESMQTWKMSKEEWFADILRPSQTDIGVFHYSKLVGLITFCETFPATVEAHLDCARETSLDLMTTAVIIAKEHAFKYGVRIGVVWVQSFNRPILNLYAKVGFVPTNISIFRGMCKGKVVEWRQFIAKNPNLIN